MSLSDWSGGLWRGVGSEVKNGEILNLTAFFYHPLFIVPAAYKMPPLNNLQCISLLLQKGSYIFKVNKFFKQVIF